MKVIHVEPNDTAPSGFPLMARAMAPTPSAPILNAHRPRAGLSRLFGFVQFAPDFSRSYGSATDWGGNMKISIAIGMLMATIAAHATVVPEIDAFSGLAAMGLIGSIGAQTQKITGI